MRCELVFDPFVLCVLYCFGVVLCFFTSSTYCVCILYCAVCANHDPAARANGGGGSELPSASHQPCATRIRCATVAMSSVPSLAREYDPLLVRSMSEPLNCAYFLCTASKWPPPLPDDDDDVPNPLDDASDFNRNFAHSIASSVVYPETSAMSSSMTNVQLDEMDGDCTLASRAMPEDGEPCPAGVVAAAVTPVDACCDGPPCCCECCENDAPDETDESFSGRHLESASAVAACREGEKRRLSAYSSALSMT